MQMVMVMVILVAAALGGCLCDDQEFRLIRYLMSNYDSAVRPSLSAAHPLHVQFDLALMHIVALDEKSGILTTNCRITQRWNDVHLRWNATDFGGVSSVRIPADHVWKPDILLHNDAAASESISHSEAWRNVMLKSTGDVTWTRSGVMKSSCPVDLQFFPFDTQLCYLNFTSWSYDKEQITVTCDRGAADVAWLQPHPEFHLTETWAGEATGPGGAPGLGFALALHRRPAPHLLRLVLPCFLVSVLAALSFCVPPSAAERVTLAMGAMVAMLLIMLTVGRTPPVPILPLVGVYQLACLCHVCSVAVLSALTLALHRRGSEGGAPPPCHTALACLSRIFCMSPCPKRTFEQVGVDVDEKGEGGGSPIERYTSSPQPLRRRSDAPNRSSDEFEKRFLRVLDRVHETLERHEARDREREGREASKVQWTRLARLTDRLLTVLFLFSAALAAALFFAFSPLS